MVNGSGCLLLRDSGNIVRNGTRALFISILSALGHDRFSRAFLVFSGVLNIDAAEYVSLRFNELNRYFGDIKFSLVFN